MLSDDRVATGCTGIAGLWPMPPPFPNSWKSGLGKITGKSDVHVQKSYVNLLCVMMSWMFLRKVRIAPQPCRLGKSLRPEQREAVNRLEDNFSSWPSIGPLLFEDLGRSATKYENVSTLMHSLTARASNIKVNIDKYAPQYSCNAYNTTMAGYRSRMLLLKSPKTSSLRKYDLWESQISIPNLFFRLMFSKLTKTLSLSDWILHTRRAPV